MAVEPLMMKKETGILIIKAKRIVRSPAADFLPRPFLKRIEYKGLSVREIVPAKITGIQKGETKTRKDPVKRMI